MFAGPSGLATDGLGNLYVADNFFANTGTGNTIKKVVLATGEVTTLAGDIMSSGSADGTGAAARFSDLGGLASDGAGNLYVADVGNGAIRKVVVATATVTTVATGFDLSSLSDVAADGMGNLYFTDGLNTIQAVVLATGAVTTLAGTLTLRGSGDGIAMAARFNDPGSVALDGAGNLFVVDVQNDTIRKVVVATGVVTTLAGRPPDSDGVGAAARLAAPRGVTNDGAGNLYVADTGNLTIRKVVLATGAVTTLAVSTADCGTANEDPSSPCLLTPFDVATDGGGNLYVADRSTVWRVVLGTGTVIRLAGYPGNTCFTLVCSKDGTGEDAQFSFDSPQGIAADGAGNLYLTDTSNDTIRKITLGTALASTAEVSTPAGSAGVLGSADGFGSAALFNHPIGVTSDRGDDVYVADTENSTIRRLVLATGAVTTLAGVAGVTGSTDGTGTAALFNHPVGVTADRAGNLYVADTGNSTIRKIVLATGAVTTWVGVPGQVGVQLGRLPAGLEAPTGVSALPDGSLIIADGDAVLMLK